MFIKQLRWPNTNEQAESHRKPKHYQLPAIAYHCSERQYEALMKCKYSLLELHAGWRAVGFHLGLRPPPADPRPAPVPPTRPPRAGSAASSTTARPPRAGSAARASRSQPTLRAGAPWAAPGPAAHSTSPAPTATPCPERPRKAQFQQSQRRVRKC